MLSFLNKYAKNCFASQNGEEGLLIEVVKRLAIDEGHAVEIGGSDGLFCSNTALLIKDHLWLGVFVETQFALWQKAKENWADNKRVKCICSHVDPYNINAFVKDNCDLLSIDTDGGDYKIFQALKAKPKIVILEIDSSIEPPSVELNSDGAAGYWPTVTLGISKGYFILCHTGNIVLIANEYRGLFPEIEGDGLENWELYFKRDWVKKDDIIAA